jgi:hydroxypyruvate isomerase
VQTYGVRFDVNCSILFTELPLLERPAAAKAAGFDGVEFWWPWDERPVPADKEADAFIAAVRDAGVELVSLNFAAGDMAAGERGLVSAPHAKDAFRANIEACTEIAARVGCLRLNAPYGNRLDPADARLTARQDELAVENLILASQAAAKAGATVLIEPINSVDLPRYPIDTPARALALIEKCEKTHVTGHVANLALLADLYHLAMMGEDLTDALARYGDRIGHVQLADAPGRGAPGTGTVDFGPPFAQLAAQGYAGRVGLEYFPDDPDDSAASFGWL